MDVTTLTDDELRQAGMDIVNDVLMLTSAAITIRRELDRRTRARKDGENITRADARAQGSGNLN